MDIEHMLNVVKSHERFIYEQGIGHGDIFDLVCALKVNNFQSMQCLTTVSEQKTIPLIMLGAGLIFDHFERNGLNLNVASRAERVSVGCWLLHFSNLLDKITGPLCEGNVAYVHSMLNELFNAILVCGYQHGARLRVGYELDKQNS